MGKGDTREQKAKGGSREQTDLTKGFKILFNNGVCNGCNLLIESLILY
jgi:hypothetical protein